MSTARSAGTSRGLLSMTWFDVLFAHWRVLPETVDPRLPASLEVDTFGDDAEVGVVPFRMTIGPAEVPLRRTFGELNLRTYVRGPDGDSGVYFFNLDADDRLGVAVARSLFRLPYYRAERSVQRTGDWIRFRSQRTHRGVPPVHFEARYGPDGPPFDPEPGSLEIFLVENYRFYTTDDDGRVYRGDVDHEPWSLRPGWAEFVENTLFEASGFDYPDGEPTLHVAEPVGVTAGWIRRT